MTGKPEGSLAGSEKDSDVVYVLVSGAAFLLCVLMLLMGVDAPLRTPVFVGVWVTGTLLTISVLRYLVRGR